MYVYSFLFQENYFDRKTELRIRGIHLNVLYGSQSWTLTPNVYSWDPVLINLGELNYIEPFERWSVPVFLFVNSPNLTYDPVYITEMQLNFQ